jgi:hypothetical protein
VRRALSAGVALLLVAACRHPSKVGTPASPETAREAKGEPTRAQKGVPPEGGRPRVPASPKALLAEGEIGKVQEALSERGYLAKERRPGALDEPTTKALRKFQKDEGLAETGFPDRLTLQKLGLDPEQSYGKVREGKGKDEGSEGSSRDRR